MKKLFTLALIVTSLAACSQEPQTVAETHDGFAPETSTVFASFEYSCDDGAAFWVRDRPEGGSEYTFDSDPQSATWIAFSDPSGWSMDEVCS